MNRKRAVSYIKPEDPEFLKVLKKQAGYDDKNHKFDELQNAEGDFVEDDNSEQPQVVVLKPGDLTAEEVEIEKKQTEILENETKADLNQRVIIKTKSKTAEPTKKQNSKAEPSKRQLKNKSKTSKDKRRKQLLSFDDDDEEESS